MANKIYGVREADVSWLATGGSNDISLGTLGAGAGRQGERQDFSTAAIAQEYEWRFFCQFNSAPVLGELVYIYGKASDGTYPANDDGSTGNIAVSAIDKVRNLELLGAIEVDQTSTAALMATYGRFKLPSRYFQPVIWNATIDALSNSSSHSGFIMNPAPPEIQ